jgi:hypothetical protein
LPGSKITIPGSRLSSITSITIDGLSAEFELVGDEIRLVIPASLKPGTHDILVQSDSGQLVVQSGLVVKGSAFNSKATTRVKMIDGKVKLYAENIVGAGKVQFFVNGKEVAWVNALDDSNPKLSFASGTSYLVRTLDIGPGNNRFEVRVSGNQVFSANYSE